MGLEPGLLAYFRPLGSEHSRPPSHGADGAHGGGLLGQQGEQQAQLLAAASGPVLARLGACAHARTRTHAGTLHPGRCTLLWHCCCACAAGQPALLAQHQQPSQQQLLQPQLLQPQLLQPQLQSNQQQLQPQQQQQQQPDIVELKLLPRTEQCQARVRAAGHEPCINLKVR